MITQLASPSVLVIDDDEDDYVHIGDALNQLYVSYVWLSGEIGQLPQQPFTRVQLIFLDLHLSNSLGKDAASYTANVFIKTVSASTAPVIVVIWSKYADDKVPEGGVPPEDQETESELFKRTLLEAEPRFKSRLIFLEMEKPKKDRPADWSARLQQQIKAALGNQSAVDLLWAWDGLVKDASASLTASLTDLAVESAAGTDPKLTEPNLKEVLQQLTRAQSGGEVVANTAPAYLVAILSQLLADQLEHGGAERMLAGHGSWLAKAPGKNTNASVASKMNSFLLASDPPDAAPPYLPGIVYRATNTAEFCRLFGVSIEILEKLFCNQQRQTHADRVDAWNAAIRPIALEISPACDVANNKRYHAILVGGVAVPGGRAPHLKLKNNEALLSLPGGPTFSLRRPLTGFDGDEVFIALSHRLRVSTEIAPLPAWFVPWFRLRELPTTSLRNLHMAYASRVGFVSMA